MRLVPALAAMLTLAACASTEPAPQAAQTCRIDRIAEMPMLAGTPMVIVPARLDGQAVSMLLDTGDERLTVLAQAQRSLRLAETSRHRTTVRGVGGESTSNDVIIQRFELGGAELPEAGAAVIDMPMHPFVQPPMAGIIGGQTLSDYDVEFDFRARSVVLWQRSGCEAIAPAWTGSWSSARLARGAGNLVTLDVAINGRSVRALLDTGAANTVVGLQAAGRLGMTGAQLASARTLVSRGADGNDLVSHAGRLGDIAVGNVHAHNLPVLISPIHPPFAEMLLGVDFLQHRDLWLSYSGQQAFIR